MSMTITHVAKWYAVTMFLFHGVASLFGGGLTVAAWIIGAIVGVLGGWNDLAAFPDHIKAMWREKSWKARDYSNQYKRWHIGQGGGDLLAKFAWCIPIVEHAEIDYVMHEYRNGVSEGWKIGAFKIEIQLVLMTLLLWFMILTW